MTRFTGSVSLRPTRIGFLVRPADRKSLSRIMRWGTCLWGGRHNPIIPVGRYPKCWREGNGGQSLTDKDVARNYLEFFEPDILVEAEIGLAKSIGFSALGDESFGKHLLSLDEFHSKEANRGYSLKAGHSIIDAYRAIYRDQRQFVLRDKDDALLFDEKNDSSLVESIFGAFPQESGAEYFEKNYREVFKPKSCEASVDSWFKVYRGASSTPFSPTYHGIESPRYARKDFCFFIFDHNKTSDLIDYWNLRLVEGTVIPVPLCWLPEISDHIAEVVSKNHLPDPTSARSRKYSTKIVFGRSICSKKSNPIADQYFSVCPVGSYYLAKSDHPQVRNHKYVAHKHREILEVKSADINVELRQGSIIEFPALTPNFSEPYGDGNFRWANVVNLKSYESDSYSLLYPANMKDRKIPRLGFGYSDKVIVSREGWVIGRRFNSGSNYLTLSDGEQAISEWLKEQKIIAEVSSAGRVAKQMIKGLGGLRNTRLIADPDTIKTLNKMSMQEITLGGTDDEVKRTFQGRTSNIKVWQGLVTRRNKSGFIRVSLENYTDKGVIKLGLGVRCPNCEHSNWYGLDHINYKMECERCLENFKVPQGAKLPTWRYRVSGPYSVPNFAEGAYSVALTLGMFSSKFRGGMDNKITYSTGLNLSGEVKTCEIDFAFWFTRNEIFGEQAEPRFVIGEAKSFAAEGFKPKDIESLKIVAKAIPHTVIVLSTMKNNLSQNEAKLLRKLVIWGWKKHNGKSRAPVIILTGTELFAEFSIRNTWEKKKGRYANEINHSMLDDLENFAIATQRVYLGLDYYKDERASN